MNPFTPQPNPFSTEPKPIPKDLSFADHQRAIMDAALERDDIRSYLEARRSLRAHRRYHEARVRDASPFPLSHDEHLASVAHQHKYVDASDVWRMTVGLTEASEWRPPLLRKMDAAADKQIVDYGDGITDKLTLYQRDQNKGGWDRDADELPSDFLLSSIALAELYGCHIDDLDRGMSAH